MQVGLVVDAEKGRGDYEALGNGHAELVVRPSRATTSHLLLESLRSSMTSCMASITSCLKSLLYSKYCGGTFAATPDTLEGLGVDDEWGGEDGDDDTASSLLARESERKRAACWDIRSSGGACWVAGLAAAMAAD